MHPKTYQNPILYFISNTHWLLVLLVLIISVAGFTMLYSAAGGNMNPWAKTQIIRFVPAITLMFVISAIPLPWLMRGSYPFYLATIIMLLIVEAIGHIGMGAQRWVSIGGVNFQPSEITKLAVILALARYFHAANIENLKLPHFIFPALLIIGIPTVLILMQPNLGTATILATTGVIVCFTAGVAWRYFIGVILLMGATAPIAWHFLHSYQKQRVLTFLNPEADPLGAGYNVIQSMIAIGSGGLYGKGFLNGSQSQLDFLPEKQTDFIFTMLGEEAGFIGCAALLACYVLLIAIGYRIAFASKNRFGALVAIGIVSVLFLHLIINIGMSMGMLPVVGVPLPLFSYGGSSMISMLFGIGLLLAAWRHRHQTI